MDHGTTNPVFVRNETSEIRRFIYTFAKIESTITVESGRVDSLRFDKENTWQMALDKIKWLYAHVRDWVGEVQALFCSSEKGAFLRLKMIFVHF